MQENFDKSLTRILVYEGGKVDDVQDPGGRTNKGITQSVYASWLRLNRLPAADVYNITDAQVRAIYKAQYWDAVRGDDLPSGLDLDVFDGAANSGPSQSIKWLQRALGITADGVIGQMTLDAIAHCGSMSGLIDRIRDRRMAFLRALKTFKRFGAGWTARVNNVTSAALAWSVEIASPTATAPAGANAKANISDAKAVVSAPLAHLGAGIGIATATVPQITDALAPASVVPLFSKIATIITVIGVGVTVAGIAYAGYVRRQKTALADALDTVAA